MAGNVGLLKHASNVPAVRARHRGDLPARRLPGGRVPDAARRLGPVARIIADDPRVAAVTLTGSEGGGHEGRARRRGEPSRRWSWSWAGQRSLRRDAERRPGRRRQRRPSSPAASTTASPASPRSASSSTSASTPEFERRMSDGLAALKVGDPHAGRRSMWARSPRRQGVADVERQVVESVKAGARLVVGGKRLPGKGNFYAPTALADIPPTAPAYRRGGVRPGGAPLPGAERGRGDRARQRLHLRPRLVGVDERALPSASGSSTRSRRAPPSSTPWSRPIRGSRSAA